MIPFVSLAELPFDLEKHWNTRQWPSTPTYCLTTEITIWVQSQNDRVTNTRSEGAIYGLLWVVNIILLSGAKNLPTATYSERTRQSDPSITVYTYIKGRLTPTARLGQQPPHFHLLLGIFSVLMYTLSFYCWFMPTWLCYTAEIIIQGGNG